jgi:hypothetical protein
MINLRNKSKAKRAKKFDQIRLYVKVLKGLAINSLRDSCMQMPSSRLEAAFVKVAELDQPSTSIDLSKVYRYVEKPSSPILVVCKRALSENFS